MYVCRLAETVSHKLLIDKHLGELHLVDGHSLEVSRPVAARFTARVLFAVNLLHNVRHPVIKPRRLRAHNEHGDLNSIIASFDACERWYQGRIHGPKGVGAEKFRLAP